MRTSQTAVTIAEAVVRPSARTSRLVTVQVAHRSADASSACLSPPGTRGRGVRAPIRLLLLSVSAAALSLSATYAQEETIKKIWNHEPQPTAQAGGASSVHYVFVPQNYGMLMNNVADVAVDS